MSNAFVQLATCTLIFKPRHFLRVRRSHIFAEKKATLTKFAETSSAYSARFRHRVATQPTRKGQLFDERQRAAPFLGPWPFRRLNEKKLSMTSSLAPSGASPAQGRTLRSICRALTLLPLTIVSLARPAWAQATPTEIAYNYGEIDTPRSTATGGAMRGLSNSVTALFVNPANMAASRVYHIGAIGQFYPEAGRQSYGGGVVDSVVSSSNIAGGVGGTWNLLDPNGTGREWVDLRGGLALPIGKVASIGAAGRMFSLTQSGSGPLGPSPASGGLPDSMIVNTFTLDLGATIRPIPELAFAVTGHNLTNTGNGFLPLMGGLGVAYSRPEFGVGVDAVLDSTTYGHSTVRVMAGGEFLVQQFAFRLGYRFDEGQETHSLAGGLAYIDRKFSVDASIRKTFVGTESTALVFAITMHIESVSLGLDPAN
jgi:hypothetical protein